MSIRIFVILFLSSFAMSAIAEREHVDQTMKAAPDGFVQINVVRGDLRVEGWDKNEIHVEGKLDESTKEFIFDVNGNDAIIEVRIEQSDRRWWGQDSEPSDLVIRVPEGSSLDVSVVSTDVTVGNVLGGLDVNAVSGDLNVDKIRERVDLQTVSGDVDLRDAAGRIRVRTVSGDVKSVKTDGQSIYSSVSGDLEVDDGGEDIEAQTVSGDVIIGSTEYLTVRGHTVSGDVEIDGIFLAGGAIEFDSVSGSIGLAMGPRANARFNLETGSGRIRNQLTSDKPRVSEYGRDQSLRFTA
ncbi:MAG: DUF4097 family beta strand repeat protein, partial [Pseudomonadales bacterium]|nr:DUF4097 family beta strand repeat protein [Pseudomonadales bacterium]